MQLSDPQYDETLFDPLDYEVTWRECLRCVTLGFPGRYPEHFFRRSGPLTHRSAREQRRRICTGCEWEVDADKSLNKSIDGRISNHAKRHGTALDDYRNRYGVTRDRVKTWIKTKLSSGHLDCGCAVTEMTHGLKDVEMHQVNPAEPFFPLTWRLVCTNHHRQMQQSSEVEYAAKQRGWELWKQARAHASSSGNW